MKRDMGLIRMILGYVEENGNGNRPLLAPEFEHFCQFEKAKIAYHIGLCHDAGFILLANSVEAHRRCTHGAYQIIGLTWEGHEKLDALRGDHYD